MLDAPVPRKYGKGPSGIFRMEMHEEQEGLLPEMQKNDAPGIKAIRMADGFPFRTVECNRIKAIKKPLPERSGRCHKAKKRGYQPRWW